VLDLNAQPVTISHVAQAASLLPNQCPFVLCALHPKVNGSFARVVFRRRNVSALITILPKWAELPDVVGLTSVLVSQGSTAGVQSLFVGVPSMYLDPSTSASTSNIAVQAGLVRVSHTLPAFSADFDLLRSQGWRVDDGILSEKLGVPENSTLVIESTLRELLRKVENQRALQTFLTVCYVLLVLGALATIGVCWRRRQVVDSEKYLAHSDGAVPRYA
jgi:hypothetical protein